MSGEATFHIDHLRVFEACFTMEVAVFHDALVASDHVDSAPTPAGESAITDNQLVYPAHLEPVVVTARTDVFDRDVLEDQVVHGRRNAAAIIKVESIYRAAIDDKVRERNVVAVSQVHGLRSTFEDGSVAWIRTPNRNSHLRVARDIAKIQPTGVVACRDHNRRAGCGSEMADRRASLLLTVITSAVAVPTAKPTTATTVEIFASSFIGERSKPFERMLITENVLDMTAQWNIDLTKTSSVCVSASNGSPIRSCRTMTTRRKTRFGDSSGRFGKEKVVHCHGIVVRVAQHTVRHNCIEPRGESNATDSLAAIGYRPHETQSQIDCGQNVACINHRTVLVEELDLRETGDFDVGEDRPRRRWWLPR